MPNTKGRDKRTEVKSEVIFLGRLLELVQEGRMLVPRFQRPYVWGNRDMLSLLDSVFSGYPIGSILAWETERDIKWMDRVGPIPVRRREGGSVSYILDGHQRIATLLGTLMLTNDHDQFQHDVDWRVFFDLDQPEFMHEPRSGLEPYHFPVRSLLSTSGYLLACREIEERETNRQKATKLLQNADKLASAIRNFQLPLISVSEADMDSAVTVFARLNQRGRPMSADQMVSALTYDEEGFNLSDLLDTFQKDLSRRGFGNLDRVVLLRVVLASLDMDIYVKDFADLLAKPDIQKKLQGAVEAAQKGVDAALIFLEKLGVVSDRLLPYGLQLVLLAEFFRHCPQPTSEQQQLLERWFWVTSFTGWFGGVNSAQARLALNEMREIARGSRTQFGVVDLDTPARPFPRRFDGRSARVRAFLIYLASLEPRSLTQYESENLDPGALLSEFGTDALARVVSRNLTDELLSSPANRMFVDRGHRGQTVSTLEDIAKNRATDWFSGMLASHGFGNDANASLFKPDGRQAIIEDRLRTLIQGERSFLKQRNVKLPTEEIANSIRDSDVSDVE